MTASDTARLSLEEALVGFRRATVVSGGTTDRFVRVGGRVLGLRFAGQALLPVIMPALAHLATSPVPQPDLTIRLWDGASTGVALQPPPWAPPARPGGEIAILRGGGLFAAWQQGDGLLSLLDRERGEALFHSLDAVRVSAYLAVAPMRHILNWWMAGRGLRMIHAAAVGGPAGGVLFAGRGGAGKSTCAMACLTGGLHYLAEDYCLLGLDPIPTAFSLFAIAKVSRGSAHLLPQLATLIESGTSFDGDKVALPLPELFPGRMVESFPLKALLLPSITGDRRPSLQPATRAEALAALAPSTIFQQAGSGEDVFRDLARLVREVPCLRLRVGPDLAALPELVAGVIGGGGP